MQRPMAHMLEAVALEMAALSQAADRLQALTGVFGHGGVDAALIEEAQGMDALAQRLDALAGFLMRISQDAPGDWRLDIGPALAAIPLSDLANRIGHPVAAPSQAVAPTGDCELF
jgi:hypothetical protein